MQIVLKKTNDFFSSKTIGNLFYGVLIAALVITVKYFIIHELSLQAIHIYKQDNKYGLQRGDGFFSKGKAEYKFLSQIDGSTDYFFAIDTIGNTELIDKDEKSILKDVRFDYVFYEPKINTILLFSTNSHVELVGFYNEMSKSIITKNSSDQELVPLKYNNNLSKYYYEKKISDNILVVYDISRYDGESTGLSSLRKLTDDGHSVTLGYLDKDGKKGTFNKETGK